jgi:hypothetical protein
MIVVSLISCLVEHFVHLTIRPSYPFARRLTDEVDGVTTFTFPHFSHPIDGYSYGCIDVAFLPANTTSLIQPLDQGVVRSFKAHYTRLYLDWVLVNDTEGVDLGSLKPSIKQCVEWVATGWRGVTQSVIANCW